MTQAYVKLKFTQQHPDGASSWLHIPRKEEPPPAYLQNDLSPDADLQLRSFCAVGGREMKCFQYIQKSLEMSCYLPNCKTTVKSRVFGCVPLPALRKKVVTRSHISLRELCQ